MKEYPHIDSVYKRDQKGKFLIGEFSTPEFEYLKDNPWVWTEKIDGTNIRIMYDGMNVRFGGKTDNAQIPTKLLVTLQNLFPNTHKLTEEFGITDVCLYGEGYGAGIQKGGGLYSAEQKFILFDVKIGHWWLKRDAVEDIAAKLSLDVVPIRMRERTLSEVIEAVKSIVEGSGTWEHPTSTLSDNALIEGYVGQPVIPLFNRKGERVITKVKFKDFK